MSLYDCKGCEERQHCNGSGSVRVFDTEDGPNSYACQCYCAVSARREREADREVTRLIQKHGKDRVQRVLESLA